MAAGKHKTEEKADSIEAASITDVDGGSGRTGGGWGRVGGRRRQQAAAGVAHSGPAKGWASGSASHNC